MQLKQTDIWGVDRPKSIACIGEAMVELSMDQSKPGIARIGVAGDALNTAVYVRRNWVGQVAFVTAVGADPMSERLLDLMAAEGLDQGLVQRCDQATIGLYAISTDDQGERSFAYWRQNSAARLMFQDGTGPDFAALEQFDAVYLSAISLAILPPAVREGLFDWLAGYRQERGGRVIFDSNYRPALWEDVETARAMVARAWGQCDIALPTYEDEQSLFGDRDQAQTLARLRGYGVRTGAMKCGAQGPVPICGSADPNHYEPVARVVDSTAAGDSFNGGFLAAWLSGGSLTEAMLAGHNQARRVLGHHGAFAPVAGS